MKLYLRSDAKAEARALVLEHHYSHGWIRKCALALTAHAPGGLFGDRGEAVAACVFGVPAARWKEPVLELQRIVRAPGQEIALTWLIAVGFKELRRRGKTEVVISYADPAQGHHGGLYQAGSWNYHGTSTARRTFEIDGVGLHEREVSERFGTSSVKLLKGQLGNRLAIGRGEGKHLYWRALNRRGKAKARRLGLKSLPYPKPGKTAPD